MQWARDTASVNLLVVTFEDIAAMLGLVIALLAVVLTMITKNPFFDALGTLAIGVLLFVVAIFLATQIRRLIAGYRADPDIQDGIVQVWGDHAFDVLELIATWNGPQSLMVVTKVRCRDTGIDADTLIARVNKAEREIASRYEAIDYLFVGTGLSVNRRWLPRLSAPGGGEGFDVDLFRAADDELVEGFLVSKHTRDTYPLIAGVPALPPRLREHLRAYGSVYRRTPLRDPRMVRFVVGQARQRIRRGAVRPCRCALS